MEETIALLHLGLLAANAQKGKGMVQKMKKIIRNVSLLFMMVTMILSGCSEKEAAKAEVSKKVTDVSGGAVAESGITIGDMGSSHNTDVVLVVDKSGSMVDSDPRHLATEGAKLFVDMEKVSGVNVALVEFSNEFSSTGLIEMKQKQNKEYLNKVLDKIWYRGHTDTGAAMKEAVSVLEQSDSSNKKAIILFTDGVTDIDVDTPGRTTEDSINDTNTAVQTAAEKGYTIYCIGLNADGSVDEEGLAAMASATGGKYHIATSVDELREFFNDIFLNIDDVKEDKTDEYKSDGDYHDFKFTISNANIAEANIVILSSRQVEDSLLIDNNGNRVDLVNDVNVFFSSSKTYTLIKLIKPALGDWTIKVKGVKNDQIKIGLIYNFNISLMVEADKTVVIKDRDVNMKAYLASEGAVITDKDFYQGMSGYITVINDNTGQSMQEELELSEDGSFLTGKFASAFPGVYVLAVHVEGNGLFRDSDNFTVTVMKNPPMLVEEIESQKIRVGQTKSIDLSEYFVDEDGDAITYSIKEEDQFTDAKVQDATLSITGINAGETTLSIYADNGASEVIECEFSVQCTTFFDEVKPYLPLLMAVILLLLLLVFFLVKRRRGRVEGRFKVSIVLGQRDENGTSQKQDYNILSDCPISSLGKKGFTMERLLKAVQGYYKAQEMDEDKKKYFAQCVEKVLPEAKKIKINGSRKSYEISIRNRSSISEFYYNGILSDNKVLLISLNDSNYGMSANLEKKFGMRFIHSEDEYTQVNIVYKM